ncbi:hypothetical protein SOP94_14610 [Peribacillus frigoritolerans]|uniref:hypothetical protein n=1 Tax=Peribacillus frigoritolerans TaxID=450367 RepID=UPI002B247249|nr:hypothetical protein [Peribacillus frigoritolerans]MEB2629684.1 hypothetical protein [Peribacillus frigoritolerans]
MNETKKIAFYISDYGFGHASRSVAIIRKLLVQAKDIQIIICHSFAMDFVQSSLQLKQNNRIKYRHVKTDFGFFLKGNSIEPDPSKLNIEFDEFMMSWPSKVEEETIFMHKENINLVISDISPLAFEAANRLCIPSLGISNFTWYTAYKGLIEEGKLHIYKEAYEKMTYFFSLAGVQEEKWGNSRVYQFNFFSRTIVRDKVNRIIKRLDPHRDKFIIFFGLGMKINGVDLKNHPIWNNPNCVFIVSSNMDIKKENVYKIPLDYMESQNFISAADLAITKAGWGIVSEAVVGNTSLLLINRPNMTEDQHTICYLKERNLCQTIDWEQFKSFTITDGYMEEVRRQNYSKPNFQFENEVEKIASEIINILEEAICG